MTSDNAVAQLLRDPATAPTPYESFYYYRSKQLHAVRSGPWKLWPKRGKSPAQLYNLTKDLAEANNVADAHPEVVARLTRFVEHARKTLGDDPGQPGSESRPRAEGVP